MCPERADLVWPVLLVLGIPAVLSGQCFLFNYQFKAMHRFVLFLFGGYYVFKPGRANRLDPYCAGGVRIFNAFPAQAVIYMGGIIHAGTNTVMN